MESHTSSLPSPRPRRSSTKPRATKSTYLSPSVSHRLPSSPADKQGLANFSKLAAELAYGKDSKPIVENRLAITQSISGTGALRIGTAFLAKFYPGAKALYLPTPTWGNHIPIAKDSGLEVKHYSYFDKKTVGLDFEGMKRDIKVSSRSSGFWAELMIGRT
jgi:aspartate/tyrosine/aromatic aminotransferase